MVGAVGEVRPLVRVVVVVVQFLSTVVVEDVTPSFGTKRPMLSGRVFQFCLGQAGLRILARIDHRQRALGSFPLARGGLLEKRSNAVSVQGSTAIALAGVPFQVTEIDKSRIKVNERNRVLCNTAGLRDSGARTMKGIRVLSSQGEFLNT